MISILWSARFTKLFKVSFSPPYGYLILLRVKHRPQQNILEKTQFNSWIKTDLLDVTCFFNSLFNAQHVSGVNTSILRSLRLIFSVISWVVLYPNADWSSLHPDTTPPQTNHTIKPTHIEPEQYNPWNNSTNKSQAPEDGCINNRNTLSIK
jgi:hypothetical protein